MFSLIEGLAAKSGLTGAEMGADRDVLFLARVATGTWVRAEARASAAELLEEEG
jgi:hypothetical protein